MNKIAKLFGIIALVAIISFSMVGCGDSPGGEQENNQNNNNNNQTTTGLVVTGIPAQYNGKYAYASGLIGAEIDHGWISGYDRLSGNTLEDMQYHLTPISNGRASFKVYDNNGMIYRESGDISDISFRIIDKNPVSMQELFEILKTRADTWVYIGMGKGASFNNGYFAISWDEGTFLTTY